MNHEEKIKLFQYVFAPKKGEKILLLVDTPHDNIKDNEKWKDRRKMAQEWYKTFKEIGDSSDFTVKLFEYQTTGIHNTPLPNQVMDKIRTSNLVIAMTEFSASSSLLQITRSENSQIRCASMPLVEKRMEKTAFTANYELVQQYALAIKKLLDKAIGAKILFNTGDTLFIDLRNREGLAEAGDCTKPGQCINFPSGEACIAPYEAVDKECNVFGESKTEGIWPVSYNTDILKYKVKKNRITEVIGTGEKAEEMRAFFSEEDSHRNIAELGIGCNPKAVVTGNPLEDEKVGLHIAYGMSIHLGGKIKSDTHFDIIHAKGCSIEGTNLSLFNKNEPSIQLIKNAQLRYDLLKK